MVVALTESQKNLGSFEQIRVEDQLNILLSGAYRPAKRFEMEVYNDVMQREHTCYDYKSNEMSFLSLAVIHRHGQIGSLNLTLRTPIGNSH